VFKFDTLIISFKNSLQLAESCCELLGSTCRGSYLLAGLNRLQGRPFNLAFTACRGSC